MARFIKRRSQLLHTTDTGAYSGADDRLLRCFQTRHASQDTGSTGATHHQPTILESRTMADAQDKQANLLFVNKTPTSTSFSHSSNHHNAQILSFVQTKGLKSRRERRRQALLRDCPTPTGDFDTAHRPRRIPPLATAAERGCVHNVPSSPRNDIAPSQLLLNPCSSHASWNLQESRGFNFYLALTSSSEQRHHINR